MTAPDPGYVRMYRNTIDRHRNAAIDDARRIADTAAALVRSMEAQKPDCGDADRIEGLARSLVRHVAALDALREVYYLTTDPDAEEARHG